MRQPKPFFRKFTKTWYVQLSNRQINLGRAKDEAFRKYHELMAGRGEPGNEFVTVAQLFEAYLEWLDANRSPGTYVKAVRYLSAFTKHTNSSLKIEAMKPALLLKLGRDDQELGCDHCERRNLHRATGFLLGCKTRSYSKNSDRCCRWEAATSTTRDGVFGRRVDGAP